MIPFIIRCVRVVHPTFHKVRPRIRHGYTWARPRRLSVAAKVGVGLIAVTPVTLTCVVVKYDPLGTLHQPPPEYYHPPIPQTTPPVGSEIVPGSGGVVNVPEPWTLPLLASGIGLVLLWRKR